MKSISGTMSTHLAGEVTTLALLWRITRTDGRSFYFTSHDEDIFYPAGSPQDCYLAAVGFSQSAIANRAGMNVDDLEAMAFLDHETITIEELRAGLFDGAEVFVSAVDYANLARGAVKLRRGWLGECIATPEGMFKTELRGLTELLQSPNGEVYGPMCRAELGDSRCGVDVAALTRSVTITAVQDRRIFTVSGADTARDDDYYVGGIFTFTSGPNAGRSMEIAAFGLGSPQGSPRTPRVTLFLPVGYLPTIGVTGTMRPGCDKTFATCKARFSNILNFRGEPYVPGLDAMMLYPDAK